MKNYISQIKQEANNLRQKTDEELQLLLDEEEQYIQQWRDNLTQEQIDSI